MSSDLKYAQAIWRLRACMVRVIPTGGASFSIPVEWEWDSVWWSGSNPVEGVVQIMARKRRREPRPEKWRYTVCGKERKSRHSNTPCQVSHRHDNVKALFSSLCCPQYLLTVSQCANMEGEGWEILLHAVMSGHGWRGKTAESSPRL